MLKNNKNGFTLIEVAAVVGVLAVTSAILLISNRLNEQQLSLSKDAAGIASAISRAKALTLQNLDEKIACGYGVHFDPSAEKDSYMIFIDRNCNYKYDDGEGLTGQGNANKLDSGLSFYTMTPEGVSPIYIKDVVFYSSDARVKLIGFNIENIEPAGVVVIKTKSIPTSYMTLKITTTGQVTTGQMTKEVVFDITVPRGGEGPEIGTREDCIPDCSCASYLASGETCPDGCGGTCSAGIIGCVPAPGICSGKTCADVDNCGVPCVVCGAGQYCINKQCRVCNCAGKNCGELDSSGCGISCPGPCPSGQTCVKQQDNSYQCVLGSVEFKIESVWPPVAEK